MQMKKITERRAAEFKGNPGMELVLECGHTIKTSAAAGLDPSTAVGQMAPCLNCAEPPS